MSAPVGRKLVEHMMTAHHWATWNPPSPNTRAYKRWKIEHDELLHRRWADQQDHTHEGAS